MADLSQYVPHGIITALAATVAWIFKRHDERDDQRFDKVGTALMSLNTKLDTAIDRQSTNHAEILKLLIKHED